jgi:Domain of unknown function (DUF4386)
MNPQKRLARIAGVLYLFVGIFGGFAEGFVDPEMYVAGNAAATAGNNITNTGAYTLGCGCPPAGWNLFPLYCLMPL